ncbi:DUF192 domain-containing protein [Noviherbaspirillum galbum]|uniref:TadE-like domain-containing protein n=1 Tax=Noviherbaspirillum galbum TaxID=2709383 RepID=A0A6B3SNT1_9BURK|nr:DUF192 domain-containing protein [Noviherbaspirillum galbum]NEX62454.1 hypothetical protein [Noviherbaspirillum galbum]
MNDAFPTPGQACDAAARMTAMHTRTGVHALDLRSAGTFARRLRGLMLAAPLGAAQGMLITRCASVHACFMKQTIDVVYLDLAGRVLGCVSGLKPWRFSVAPGRRSRTTHALELQQGAIARMDIRPGDRLSHPLIDPDPEPGDGKPFVSQSSRMSREHGAALVEFISIGPVLTILGLAILQYALLFVAKNQINHAAFMAARTGSVENASLDRVLESYQRALVPLYGGGTDDAQLQESLAKVRADLADRSLKIELLNPVQGSFDDWNDPVLQDTLGKGRRVIPYNWQALKDPAAIGPRSGQNIQDANLIKLRITHGYRLKVPFVSTALQFMLRWADDGSDPFLSGLYEDRRIPVVTHVALHMQSDAIEPDKPVIVPGADDADQLHQPTSNTLPVAPPKCLTIGCTVIFDPNAPGGNESGGSGTNGGNRDPLYGCPPGDTKCTQLCTSAG